MVWLSTVSSSSSFVYWGSINKLLFIQTRRNRIIHANYDHQYWTKDYFHMSYRHPDWKSFDQLMGIYLPLKLPTTDPYNAQ